MAARPSGSPADPVQPLFDEAEAYLNRLRLPTPGVHFCTRVMPGAPPEMIVTAAGEVAADLIVMSTHGRSGFTRLIYGSVAEAVLRGSPVPVLLVPSRATNRQTDDDRDLVRLGLLPAHLP